MSFGKNTRNLLAKTVAACRRRLIKDVTDQLRGDFGLHPDGTVLPLDKLTHLSPDQNSAARRLRDLLDHYTVGAAGKESDRRKAAYERTVLEISFTVLNRLAALRLCEERALVIECVRKGTISAGFQMFERISGGALGGRYDTYRVFLECLFDELALDLGVLFDRMTPQSAVFPSERCLEDVLAELNNPELTHLWTEDETIGWVYQYFNPPEERKAMREASQAPRNSRELAVRNQFFTPRYVVEFLTDNTLGRIWYEMRKGGSGLKEECRYLVRRPNEIFLAPAEKAPADQGNETDLTQEELLRKPVHIEYRPKKDPRDLRVLDPACGSGHFLLYAFDLLERIYEEAWADPESPKSEITGSNLREDFDNLDDLRHSAPKLIIEHNLHGIDIDPRAVQIAALALWLRAQKTWKDLGIKAAERPRIARANIVTAEPMPGEEDMRREFTTALKPRVLGQLVDIVFDKMKLAGEAGPLLMIEEEIKDAVSKARKQWLEGPKPEQQLLFPGVADPRPQQQELCFDVKGITNERFWEQAEDRILEALKDYAERAENGHDVRRRLFAEDAARGFAFIDLCRKRYDVVLMNPPFGKATTGLLEYLKRAYLTTQHELAASFMERAAKFLAGRGRQGAITTRSPFFLKKTANWRKEFLAANSPQIFLDLGWGVLEAKIEICAHVFAAVSKDLSLFVAVLHQDDKQAAVQGLLSEGLLIGENTYVFDAQVLRSLPNSPMAYWIPQSIVRLFADLPLFESPAHDRTVRQGLATADDFRFLRAVWEIPPSAIGFNNVDSRQRRGWIRMVKGGEFSEFFSDVHLAVDWAQEGRGIKEYVLKQYPYLGEDAGFVVKNEEWYFRPGFTWSDRGDELSVRFMPSGCIFSCSGPALFAKDSDGLCALWNSTLARYIMKAFVAIADERPEAGSPHWTVGQLKFLPYPQLTNEVQSALHNLELRAWHLRAVAMLHEETSFAFCTPFEDLRANLHSISATILTKRQQAGAELGGIKREIDSLVFQLYRIPERERKKLSDEIVTMQYRSTGRVQEFAKDLLSWAIGLVLGRWDVRIALDPSLAPKLPDPFDPLPVCPPGMLVGLGGHPALPDHIVSEEWLRARTDANALPPEGSVKHPTVPDDGYPLRVSWDGILVDDSGSSDFQPHRDDIVRRVREVLDLLWQDKAHEIEQEASDIIGVSDLRDYFRRPAGFFQDHLKRYSKSRRKAPIFWPLSTASGSYTIWLYYHRLTDQILYAAVNKYMEPKIAEIERWIARTVDDLKASSGRDATRLTDRLNEARVLLGELRDLREELLRIAGLPFKPDLNDGVIINAAPFSKLFRLRSWTKDTEECWKKLEKGDYDWAHLAYTIWPDRVREVCKTDRSIAIAHGLEALCEVVAHGAKNKGGPSRGKKIRRPEPSFRESGQDAD